MPGQSPATKRMKLEDDNEPYSTNITSFKRGDYGGELKEDHDEDEDMNGDHCSICLQPISDRTVIPACSHEFCFECLLMWTEQSRRCPLCSGQIGEYLIHNIRSKYDYQKHYLAPLRTSPRPDPVIARRRRAVRREVQWGRSERRERDREREAADELERAIEKRRWVYRHRLYAKHVASNSYTRYRPFPLPAQFATNPDLIARATIFVRRELRVWDSLDVEFLTTFTISLMKSLDIRSEPAVKLLAEFLDIDAEYDSENPRANAEHFAHELYSYLRSPFRDLTVYDSVVQYDAPIDVPPPQAVERSRRWRRERSTVSLSRSPSPGPSRTQPQLDIYTDDHYTRPRSPTDRSQRRRSASHRDERPEKEHNTTSDIPLERHKSRSRERDSRRNGRHDREKIDSPHSRDSGCIGGSAGPKDIKGKGRATVSFANEHSSCDNCPNLSAANCHLEERDQSGPLVECAANELGDEHKEGRATLQQDSLSSTHPPNRSHGALTRPKIRRNAWQSLQAHLTSSVAERVSKPIPDHSTSHLALTSDAPAPTTGGGPLSESQTPFDTASSSGPLTPVPDTTVTGTPALLAETPQYSAPRLSAPEIMARTRAKLARLKKEQDAEGVATPKKDELESSHANANSTSQPPSSAGRVAGDGFANMSTNTASMVTLSAESPQTVHGAQKTNEVSSTATAATLRAKLLTRLEEERRVQQKHTDTSTSANGGLHTYTIPIEDGSRSSVSPVTVSDDRASAEASDSSPHYRRNAELMESKLRVQAQLRVRLTAEKRKAEDFQRTDINSQEASLKARLKRAR